MLPPDGGMLTQEAVCTLRTALVTAGYSFIPEYTGGKFTPKPWSEWRKTGHSFDPAVCYVSAQGPLLNTALRCDGLVIIDHDIDDPSDIEAAVEIMHDCLGAPRCVRTRATAPRQAAVYRTDAVEGLYAARKGEYGAIEVFSGPLCKVTCFGQHTDKTTGVRSRLTWHEVPGNVAQRALTTITPAQAEAFLDAVEDVLGEDITRRSRIPGEAGQPSPEQQAFDLDEIGAAMAYVPNTARTWDEWNHVGMMLYGASGGDDRGLRAFSLWSRQNPHTRHRNCTARWQDYASSPPTKLGAGSLFYRATANGYRRPAWVVASPDRLTARQTRASQRLSNFNPGA